ncbi:hypothetical protein CIB48_g4261 [Xylaria polymorpha]|nr:hypothetical protein CIB48_g4261 [Xylaria polymorpha]
MLPGELDIDQMLLPLLHNPTLNRALDTEASWASIPAILALPRTTLHREQAEGIQIGYTKGRVLGGFQINTRHTKIGDLAGTVGLVGLEPARRTQTPATAALCNTRELVTGMYISWLFQKRLGTILA